MLDWCIDISPGDPPHISLVFLQVRALTRCSHCLLPRRQIGSKSFEPDLCSQFLTAGIFMVMVLYSFRTFHYPLSHDGQRGKRLPYPCMYIHTLYVHGLVLVLPFCLCRIALHGIAFALVRASLQTCVVLWRPSYPKNADLNIKVAPRAFLRRALHISY